MARVRVKTRATETILRLDLRRLYDAFKLEATRLIAAPPNS